MALKKTEKAHFHSLVFSHFRARLFSRIYSNLGGKLSLTIKLCWTKNREKAFHYHSALPPSNQPARQGHM